MNAHLFILQGIEATVHEIYSQSSSETYATDPRGYVRVFLSSTDSLVIILNFTIASAKTGLGWRMGEGSPPWNALQFLTSGESVVSAQKPNILWIDNEPQYEKNSEYQKVTMFPTQS